MEKEKDVEKQLKDIIVHLKTHSYWLNLLLKDVRKTKKRAEKFLEQQKTLGT